MEGGTNSGNTAAQGGGVYVSGNGAFTKTGGTIYGDTDNVFDDNATDNTATSTGNDGTNGHAVFYYNSIDYTIYFYYRNATLGNDASGNISTADELPITGGETVGNWTKR
jgi:hypothetical protein